MVFQTVYTGFHVILHAFIKCGWWQLRKLCQVSWFIYGIPTCCLQDPRPGHMIQTISANTGSRNIIARSCDLYMGSQQWSHALLDCGWRDPKKICARSGDLFMGSHRVCLWDPRTGHMLRLTLADGIPRTLLLGQVITVWDPMLGHMSLLIIADKVVQTARRVRTFTYKHFNIIYKNLD